MPNWFDLTSKERYELYRKRQPGQKYEDVMNLYGSEENPVPLDEVEVIGRSPESYANSIDEWKTSQQATADKNKSYWSVFGESNKNAAKKLIGGINDTFGTAAMSAALITRGAGFGLNSQRLFNLGNRVGLGTDVVDFSLDPSFENAVDIGLNFIPGVNKYNKKLNLSKSSSGMYKNVLNPKAMQKMVGTSAYDVYNEFNDKQKIPAYEEGGIPVAQSDNTRVAQQEILPNYAQIRKESLENDQKDYIYDWLSARKDILGENAANRYLNPFHLFKTDSQIGEETHEKQTDNLNSVIFYNEGDIPETKHMEMIRKGLSRLIKDYDSTGRSDQQVLRDYKLASEGTYFPKGHFIKIHNDSESTRLHELVHSLLPTSQSRKISSILRGTKYLEDGKRWDGYMDDSEEIYSRMMEFRYNNQLDPNKVYTKEDIENWKSDKKINEHYFLDRYKPEIIERLLNEVAQNKDNKNLKNDYA